MHILEPYDQTGVYAHTGDLRRTKTDALHLHVIFSCCQWLQDETPLGIRLRSGDRSTLLGADDAEFHRVAIGVDHLTVYLPKALCRCL